MAVYWRYWRLGWTEQVERGELITKRFHIGPLAFEFEQ